MKKFWKHTGLALLYLAVFLLVEPIFRLFTQDAAAIALARQGQPVLQPVGVRGPPYAQCL